MSRWRAPIGAALIGGLVLLVGWLLDRPAGDGDPARPTSADQAAALACPTALQAVCVDLAGELGTSARQYQAGTDPGEGVVVIAPAADLPAGMAGGPVVARSPVVITVWRERSLVLAAECGAVDAACITRVLGSSWADLGGSAAWGDVKLGLSDPSRSEAGLIAWSLLAGAGLPPGLESSLRLRADDDGALLLELAQFGDSRADVALATEVAVAAQLDNVIGRGARLEVFYPDPGPWIEFVASGTGPGVDRTIARLLESDLQGRIAAFGLRPAAGSPTGLPDGLGEPGDESPPLDDDARARLLDAWEDMR